jgi:hypothetical protein
MHQLFPDIALFRVPSFLVEVLRPARLVTEDFLSICVLVGIQCVDCINLARAYTYRIRMVLMFIILAGNYFWKRTIVSHGNPL